ncbi:enoyl-CoA hydratase/isomerase family protein [Spongiibacter marinus]|uniref:enoyl-CoA hydratase/isomerase family protein n=1 Tax=Spongiibacter marinus TaxID=354246 RepID=UPI0019600207|nr:enoyl-CoA hydratase-related protein [Spongiibacter marinus]MBM7422962.1 enoyl-CoA hydratase [Spongiibacter marinus]
MNYDHYQALKIQRENRILTITIDRPEAKNAVNAALHGEFSRIFYDIDRDEETDVVVITGTSEAFSAGGDLDWLIEIQGDPAATAEAIVNDRKIQNSLLDLEKPVIAKVRGPAIGLGCTLALFCDFIYATADAKFADPHVSVGLVAGDGGAVIWPQLIGYARAKRYLLTGDFIDGKTAELYGLITETVADDELDAAVDAMANRMANGAPFAIKWTKSSINAGLKQVANAIIDRAAAFENMTMMTEDHKTALMAFKDRIKPQFHGR